MTIDVNIRGRVWDPSYPGLHGRWGTAFEESSHGTLRVRLDKDGDKPGIVISVAISQWKRPEEWGR
jgi:hypothetical protein